MNYAWLRNWQALPQGCATPAETAREELRLAGLDAGLREDAALGEGWEIVEEGGRPVVHGGSRGLLYGAYALMAARKTGLCLPRGVQQPRYTLRMIDCWDNPDGTIERGYAGRSLWFEGGRMAWQPERIAQLGRMLASVGLNVLCINNVNVGEEGARLITEDLPELARLAAAFRPFGVRLMVSIDFSQPLRYGVETADPLSPAVLAWWTARADAVWAAIPDFAGFLVKADSEHRPGPMTYGRSHAEGANMLARALAPHGGVLVWRAFVYNCLQDWRDTHTDRPMAAYETYAPLDGQFDDNVILQVKNGPFDFQVREPISPTFWAMPHTRLALEVQLAQEYTGQQIDLYAMNPMWREWQTELPVSLPAAVAAVSNLGRDENWCGHPFAAVNLYGFGRYAWDPEVSPEEVIRTWARLTYALPENQEDALCLMLLNSRSIYEQYTAPLGIGWMITPHNHYGPDPWGYEYSPWGTYHRADRSGIGIDRTEKGTGFTRQQPPEIAAKYADPAVCPDEQLLFYHRLPWDYVMRDGRTLARRILDDHREGVERVEAMAAVLRELELPEPDRSVALSRMERQLQNAANWRDIISDFVTRLSGVC